MSEQQSFDLLLIGFDDTHMDLLTPIVGTLRIKKLNSSAEIESFLESFQLPAGAYVFVSTHSEGMTHMEIAQALNSYYQGIHIIFLTLDRTKLELEALKKNGFTESLLLPLDRQILVETIENIKASGNSGGYRKYKAVKLIDIQPGQEMPFEIRAFLSFNNKYVVLNGSGKITEKKLQMLKERNANSLFIDIKQIEKFYEFTAEQLIQSGNATNDSVSNTEREEKMQSTVRQLFRSILDASADTNNFENGKDLADQSKKIVEQYIKQKTGVNLSEKLKELTGEGKDSYSHAQIVSTIACLISMATQIGQPEDLAIAGLFHDLGIQGNKEDISIFEIDTLTEQERSSYILHPRVSLNLLKEKRITVIPMVAEIIEKHHERIDGKGFPSQVPASKIPHEAHILAYADAFEYLTRRTPGKTALQPSEAHKIISEKLGLSYELLLKIERFIVST